MIRFGQAAVEEATREVRLDGVLQHLEPQAFDVFCFLFHNRDRVVAKTEILDAVWGDQFVSESALTTRIKEIRRALGDDGRRQQVIKNVRGRGYRFVAEVVSVDSDSPVPQTPAGTGARLPATRPLFGRDDDLDAVLSELAVRPLVSLVGPGGTGKTSLAVACAHRVQSAHSDGVIFVDLTLLTEASDVVAAVRQAAGITASTTSDRDAIAAIGSLDALLVIDNCEHLIDAVADVVRRLVAPQRRLKVLSTSRQRLGLADEVALGLGPLASADARSLFVARAARVQPGFALAEGDERILAELIALLDRLPLAIEMAAGRLSAMSLPDVHALLSERLDMLRSADRDVVERHRTIADLVAWSEALLDPAGRKLFTDLSVFAGPAAIDDIVGVLSADGADRITIVDGLTSLVDQSLVSADLTHRPATYRLLDTTRSHARRLRSDRCEREHAEWFLSVADAADRDLRTVREASGDGRFEAVLAELRAAHSWARHNDLDLAGRLTGALAHYGHTRLWGEPARWAADLLDRLLNADRPTAIVMATLAADAGVRADYERATRLAEQALLVPDTRAEILALEALADVFMYTGDLDAAARTSARLARLGERAGDLHGYCTGHVGVALARIYGGDHDGGLATIDNVVDIEEMAPTDVGWLRYALAEGLVADQPARAIDAYREAFELAASVGGRYLALVARASMAAALARHGEPDEAIAEFRSVIADHQRHGNLTHATTTLRNLVELLVRLELNETAMTLLGALSDDDVKSTFGSEEESVERSRAIIQSRVGHGEAERWAAAGRGRGVQWALSFGFDSLPALA